MISKEAFIGYVRKNPIAVGCAVVALACVVTLYIRIDLISNAEAELETKSAEGRRLAQNVRNAAQLPEQLAAITGAMSEIQPRLLRADELAKNLQYFYKLEAETGTKLLDLRQLSGGAAPKGAAKTAFATVTFNLTVRGEYAALLEFLRRLENGVHYARVLTAAIASNAPERSGPLSLQLTVELLGQP